MPFVSAKQEMFMMIKMHERWKEWVKKYGHHPDFKEFLKKKRKVDKRKKKKRQ